MEFDYLPGLQTESLLGPPFSLGVMPDVLSQPQPSVHQQCYAGLSKQNTMEVNRIHHMLRAIMKTIHDTLYAISMNFLKSQVGDLPAAARDFSLKMAYVGSSCVSVFEYH